MTHDSGISKQEVRRRVNRWAEKAVVDLDFCPFAASVYHRGVVRTVVAQAEDPPEAVEVALDEASHLLARSEEEVATTLVVFPASLSEFRTFLDVAETARYALEDAGAAGILQIATFHPDYQFAGTEPDALENYTNRSPFPILHLLREDDVSEAVDNHPDPEGIPQRNIERLREMGREEVEAIWSEFE